MRTSESIDLAAAPGVVFEHVADLDAYPRWLPLVHRADRVDEDPDPAWDVELRARVGPFARSKRLRMERVAVVDSRLVVFERAEVDGREHARWALRAELEPTATGTRLTMHLAYDGGLWTGGVLERVLDEEIRRGRTGLAALVSGDRQP
jgi:uncharacterized protein YndB with AHSA1/START domain